RRRLERPALRERRALPVERGPARGARRGAPDRRRRAAALRALTPVPGRMTTTRARQTGPVTGLITPAPWVPLARATVAVGVAALAADSFTHGTPVALLVTLA